MNTLADDFRAHLPWLTTRRWYGDKARTISDIAVEAADRVQCDETWVRLVVIRCIFISGVDSIYFVPLVESDAPLPERDATLSADFLRWLVAGFPHERRIDSGWSWRRIGRDFPATDGLDFSRVRAISTEQSNTSIVYDGAFIGKVFRKLQPGINPDLEIVEHIMRVGTFANVPALYGVLEYWQPEREDILAVQDFVPNAGDGWTWLLDQLAQPARCPLLLDDIALLGTRTAQLHLALSVDLGDDAFTPALIECEHADAFGHRVVVEMQGSLDGLASRLDAQQLAHLRDGLSVLVTDAQTLVGTSAIRVHGDYHLGQTLRTLTGDFVIIDFEGEPGRGMAERRQKHPALKDVAGMLRSLDYAAATLGHRFPEQRDNLTAWTADASNAFIAAYREAIADAPVSLVPRDDASFQRVLNLLVAEKALYEVRYEQNNRPDWLHIPLGALLRLVGMEAA